MVLITVNKDEGKTVIRLTGIKHVMGAGHKRYLPSEARNMLLDIGDLLIGGLIPDIVKQR